jgi:hypothetical protein
VHKTEFLIVFGRPYAACTVILSHHLAYSSQRVFDLDTSHTFIAEALEEAQFHSVRLLAAIIKVPLRKMYCPTSTNSCVILPFGKASFPPDLAPLDFSLFGKAKTAPVEIESDPECYLWII